MDFRTTVPPLKGMQGLIDYSSSVVMLGSCFTDNIGSRLNDAMFDCCHNPCGTLYNPASIASSLLDILYERPYTEADLVEHAGLWHSFSHHSRFSGDDKAKVLDTINHARDTALKAMSHASVFIVTFGTSWIFRLAEGNAVVANCHKMPPAMFRREMLSSTQTYGLWKKMLRELSARFPRMKVIFTVSPIRHLSDGAHANQLSKAALLEAVDRLTVEFPGLSLLCLRHAASFRRGSRLYLRHLQTVVYDSLHNRRLKNLRVAPPPAQPQAPQRNRTRSEGHH